jgi:small conductance mechanosensitive channel
VRPYCNNKDYWQVYFDTNRIIKEVCTSAGYAVPEQHYAVRGSGGGLAMSQNA